MIKRPTPNEDDEDLLKQQEDFFRKKAENKVKLAAVPFGQENEAPSIPSTSTSNPTADTVPPVDIQEQIANTFEDIPTDMKLNNILEKNAESKSSLNLRFDTSRGFPKAVRRDPDLKPSKGSIFSQHIKRLRKEEPECSQKMENSTSMDIDNFSLLVKEKCADGKITSNFATRKPKFTTIHNTTLSIPDQKQIHEQNASTLSSMSEPEILAERDRLIATMDPAIVAYLKSERRKKEREKLEETRNFTIQEQNETAENIKVEELVTPAEVLSEPNSENWLNFNKIETNKLAWMKSVDIPKGLKDQSFEARFDFDGYLLPFSEESITEKNRTLYHHGDEAGRPGYSLQEILQLSRSNVIQQKIVALNTLANILAMNSTGIYDTVIDIPIEQIFFVLRICLDDNTPAVLNAGIKAMRNLIYFQLDETCLDNLLSFGLGSIQPILAVDNALEDDSTVNDQQLVELNLVKCLARTDILTRIRYIINTVKPGLETIVYCVEILTRLARDSDFLENKLFKCDGLISSLVSHFLPHPSSMKFDQNYPGYNMPLVQVIKFFRILCSRSKKTALKVLRPYNLPEILTLYLYEDTFSQNASGMKLQIECMHFWSILIHYGLVLESIRSHEAIILRLLTYHFQNTDNFETTTLVRQNHASALLLLISQILKKGHVLPNNLKDVFEMCATKWAKQFKNFGKYSCGKSQLISALVICCASFVEKQENENTDLLLEEIIQCITFEAATRNIINGSLLLNNYETHKSSANIKSLEAAAWYTMEHIIPLMQSNSCFPFFYALSCSVLASKSQKVKQQFLDHPNLKNYLTALQKSETYSDTGNWFTRCESFTIMNVLKIAKSIEKHVDPTLYYEVAVKCLCVFTSEQKSDMEWLLESVVFCKEFYPVEVIFQNARIDVEWNTELGTSWKNLEEIKRVYANVLGLKSNLVNLEDSVSLDMSIGNVIPVDWIYTPLILLYSNQQANSNVMGENEQLEIIKNCLRWILIYETHFPSLAASISPTEKYCRLACLFLGSDNLFLIEEIQNLLKRNFEILMKFEKQFNFKKEIAGLANFQDFYTQLLEQYQGVSYGNKLFGNVLLVPLAQRHNAQFRKTLWSEYRGVIQVFNVTASEIWCDLESYKTPAEEDITLLRSYRTALVTNSVQKNSVLYEIARHHLEAHRTKLAAKRVEKESDKMDET